MTTKIRADISKKNPYWLERHHYYELKHFCLQYPYWKKMRRYLDGYSVEHGDCAKESFRGDRVHSLEKLCELRELYTENMTLVERTAKESSHELHDYILEAVTQDYSYEELQARRSVPCGREMYYTAYRRFFWLLSHARK